MEDRHKSCAKRERCKITDCDAANCDNYEYNMKRFDTFSQNVDVEMSDDQLVAVGQDLIDAKDVISEADAEFKTAKSKRTGIVDKQEEIIDACVNVMKSKTQTVQKDVEECRDHVEGVYTLSYVDDDGAKVILEERPLTDAEQQQELDLIERGKTAEEKADEAAADEKADPKGGGTEADPMSVTEAMLEEATAVITQYRMAKTATLQRKLKITPELAHKILETLQALGKVGPVNPEGDGEPREILFELPSLDGVETNEGPESGDDNPQGEDN